MRRVRGRSWTWGADGCSWAREEAPPCRQTITACDRGERIAWSARGTGRCGVPPIEAEDALTLHGWSSPYGQSGSLITCVADRPDVALDRADWDVLPGTRLVRWRLAQTTAGGGKLAATLDVQVAEDGSDSYDFQRPDSLRFVGRFGSGGTTGTFEVFLWQPEGGGWTSVDRMEWTSGRGSWTHTDGIGPAVTRSWGSAATAEG